MIDTLHLSRRKGLSDNDAVWRFEKAVLKSLEDAWRKPDEGIWEIRGPRQHFTHSKVMAWVAFDRAIKSVEAWGYDGPVDRWRKCRAAIHAGVCDQGYNPRLWSFVQAYGSELLDASLLMIPLVGFLPPDDPRVVGTAEAIGKGLMKDGFVQRRTIREHVEGVPMDEATFLPCSFWYVDNLALLGRHDEAVEMFERLLAVRNDVGLLAEEYNVKLKRQLGNFPQAFSHVGLVNSANNLAPAREGPAEHRKER
jgi:GH15 family glucan-1,4-alpha-glucosidase